MEKAKALALKPGDKLRWQKAEFGSGVQFPGYQKQYGEEVEFLAFDGKDMYERPVVKVQTLEGARSFTSVYFE